METLQFEAVKVALKQDKTGYMLTLNIHPDEIPEGLMRDFVGARYQVVMVRLNGEEKPTWFDPPQYCAEIQNFGLTCLKLIKYLTKAKKRLQHGLSKN